jgi:hypothetical protein
VDIDSYKCARVPKLVLSLLRMKGITRITEADFVVPNISVIPFFLNQYTTDSGTFSCPYGIISMLFP